MRRGCVWRGGQNQAWENRNHFFCAAAEAMRRILIERARRNSRLKRGGRQQIRLDIADLDLATTTPDDHVLLITEALEQLEKDHPEEARVVLLKFFGGLTNQEVADVLNISRRTIARQWATAKIWLYQQIRRKT